MPDKAEELDGALDRGSELTSNSDRDNKWFAADGDIKRVRLVDLWYRHDGHWCWCLFTGSGKLAEGRSPFTDEKGRTVSKYIMFSGAVDHDGDRYGFVRNLKSAQDEINQRRSKGLHELNTRRIIGEHGAFDDVESRGARRRGPTAWCCAIRDFPPSSTTARGWPMSRASSASSRTPRPRSRTSGRTRR